MIPMTLGYCPELDVMDEILDPRRANYYQGLVWLFDGLRLPQDGDTWNKRSKDYGCLVEMGTLGTSVLRLHISKKVRTIDAGLL
jgi:hypothetical protein